MLVIMLYNWIWKNEDAPRRWREGVVVNLSKKGDKADPWNYREIPLRSTVGKTFGKSFNGNDDGEKGQKKRRASRVYFGQTVAA